jgi:glutathione S-transferase
MGGTPVILIGQYDSPFVRRVAASMTLLGLPFTRNPLSVFGDADRMRTINPLGRVPSLVLDDGEVIADSGAILDHLDETVGPERALLPRSGKARRDALQIVTLACGAGELAVSLAFETLLRPAEKHHQPFIDRRRTQIAAALAALDGRADPAWLDAGRPRQTGVTAACILGYLRLRLPDTVPKGLYPALDRLAAMAETLPAFVACRPAADETIPAPPAA